MNIATHNLFKLLIHNYLRERLTKCLGKMYKAKLSLFGLLAASTLVAQKNAEKATAENPNLIFIISDQLRLDALSCMGNKLISTPNMDRLADEGVIFTRAYSQSPVSVPSRSCMLTGNSLCNTGILGNTHAYEYTTGSVLTGNEPIFSTDTYDEVLAKNGYDCEYYGKWHSPERKAYVYSNRPITCAGLSNDPVLGLGLKENYVNWWKADLKITTAPFQTGALSGGGGDLYYMPDALDARVIDPTLTSTVDFQNFGNLLIDHQHTESAMDTWNTLATIEKNKTIKFSLHCSFGPPHPPFVVSEPYYGSLNAAIIPTPANFFVNSSSSAYYKASELQSPYFSNSIAKMGAFQNPATIGIFLARYYEMVKEIDDKLGEILKKLDDLGLTNKTMIVFCADHGEMLGSHGMNSKNNFYDESARVPLIIRFPDKISAGQKITTPVSLIDVRPTIEDYMGLPTYTCDGKTLRPFIENTYDKSLNYYTVSEWNNTTVPAFMVRDKRYKLMFGQTHAANSVDGFFDLQTDSLEQNNLLKSASFSQTDRANAENSKLQLLKWLKKVNSPYFYSVKARAIGKKFSTYALYKNDIAKINGAAITALSGLPTGVSYRILPNDTLEISVTNAANVGVYNFNATVNGTAKTLSFEILSEFQLVVPVAGVKITGTSTALNVGNSLVLTAAVTPWDVTNKIVSWTTNNGAVATVNSNGLVTAFSAGTAAITATTQDGGKSDTFTITATGVKVGVSGITITPSTATIETKSSKQLLASIAPSNATFQTVSWSTSNPAVATVTENGLVNAVGKGNATITATSVDGGIQASSAITVISSLYVDNCDATLGWNSSSGLVVNSLDKQQGSGCVEFSGSTTDEYKKVFSPAYNSGVSLTNGILRFWYYVSDVTKCGTPRVELGSAGVPDVEELSWGLTGLTNGWNQIILKLSNASKLGTTNLSAINWFRLYDTKSGSITTRIDAIEIINSDVNGLNDLKNNKFELHLYPNPLSQNELSLDVVGFNAMDNVQVRFTNLLGQIVYQKRIDNSEHIKVNTSGFLKKSIYFVTVESGQTKLIQKLIVK